MHSSNCRIGRTYFICHDSRYACYARGHLKRLSDEEKIIHKAFLEHLEISGKIDKIL